MSGTALTVGSSDDAERKWWQMLRLLNDTCMASVLTKDACDVDLKVQGRASSKVLPWLKQERQECFCSVDSSTVELDGNLPMMRITDFTSVLTTRR